MGYGHAVNNFTTGSPSIVHHTKIPGLPLAPKYPPSGCPREAGEQQLSNYLGVVGVPEMKHGVVNCAPKGA